MTKRDVTPGSDRPCLTLHDGRVVEVRPLEPSDRGGLAAAVRRLSDETRYLRFASPKPELTERELDFLLDVDHHSREAILAVDPSTGYGVGVVRYPIGTPLTTHGAGRIGGIELGLIATLALCHQPLAAAIAAALVYHATALWLPVRGAGAALAGTVVLNRGRAPGISALAARSADSGRAHHLRVRHVDALGAANVDDHHDNLLAHRAASDDARRLHVHAELGHQRDALAVQTSHLRHRHLVAEVLD
jgi:hypothetical protein